MCVCASLFLVCYWLSVVVRVYVCVRVGCGMRVLLFVSVICGAFVWCCVLVCDIV